MDIFEKFTFVTIYIRKGWSLIEKYEFIDTNERHSQNGTNLKI